MAKIFAISNQKGGVGKTTTAINLSVALAENHKKVLLVDIDPQGNSTFGMGIDKDMVSKSIYDVLVLQHDVKECLLHTQYQVDVIPATIELAKADFELATSDEQKQFHLKYQLDKVKKQYDYIIIDCPPSLGLLNINALVACDGVIVPVQCEYYALEGLISLLTTIRRIQSSMNRKLEIEGVLLTMYDSRTKLANEMSIEVRKFFKEKVYEIAIPRSIKIPSAQYKQKPVIAYDRNCSGSKAYFELAEEILKKK